jgi:hypothetical protein
MLPLDNYTPFAVEGLGTRDERGHEFWLVGIKASFEIDPEGKQMPLKKQIPLNMAPVFAADPNELLDEDDFNIEKKHTDVLIAGHAYAPEGRPSVETIARVKIGDLDKAVKVTGDRIFLPGPAAVRMSQPEPFINKAITWRRTYGGTDTMASRPDWDPRNPIGTGFSVGREGLIGKTAPNFEYPDAPFRDNRNGQPAGFGPVSRHWQPRAKYAGTYGDLWKKTRDPLPPSDFNRLYYQCAPEDQQTRTPLIGYEDVRLGGFTLSGFMQFLLPRITFDIITHFRGRPDAGHEPAILHTLRIMPDDRQFSMTWVSALPVPYDEDHLLKSTVRIRRRSGVSPAVIRTGVWTGPL